MRFFKYLLFTFIICSLFTNLQAQASEQQTQSINEGSVTDQFEYAIRKSNNYTDGNGQSYEVIRRSMMLNLKKNASDSLAAIQGRLDKTTDVISTQQEEINTLKTDLATTQETLTSTQGEKDSMSLFGMQMSKTAYNLLMWSIIAGLFVFLLFFILKFKHSNVVTKEAKAALATLEDEFKAHRRTALEREQKVKRQLQDELNKHGG